MLCPGIWVSFSRSTSWDYILTSPPFLPLLPCRINLFTNNLEGPVLDHRYYAGVCSPHYILNTRFRKPYNVENFIPQVCASQEATTGPWQGHWQRSQTLGSRPCQQPPAGPAQMLRLFSLSFSSSYVKWVVASSRHSCEANLRCIVEAVQICSSIIIPTTITKTAIKRQAQLRI